MTQETPEGNPEVLQARIRAAEQAEQAQLELAEKKHLTQRVVTLRVHLDQARDELAQALSTVALLQQQIQSEANYEPDNDREYDDARDNEDVDTPES